MIIAIDGPAASGKGTLARRLAVHYGLPHLDTGLLYRAAGLRVLKHGGDPADPAAAERAARAVRPADLADPDLRGDDAATAASKVAAVPEVRAALLEFQRAFAHQPGGAVLDGRDTGTVVCPDADVKIFVAAAPEVRADRRFRELRDRGQRAIYAEILRDMKERDERDSRRTVAPMHPAADAVVIDTSDLDADQAFAQALAIVEDRAGRR